MIEYDKDMDDVRFLHVSKTLSFLFGKSQSEMEGKFSKEVKPALRMEFNSLDWIRPYYSS